MKQTLQLRLTQQLALTPQLQQSIRLLQLSTLELNQELEQILSDNPMIERLDDVMNSSLRISPNGSLDNSASNAAANDYADERIAPGPGSDSLEQGEVASDTSSDFDAGSEQRDGADAVEAADFGDSGDWSMDGAKKTRNDEGDDDRDFAQLAGAGIALRDHLMQQLAGTRCSAHDRGLVTVLIDNLDHRGFLDATLEELLPTLPDELEFELDDLQMALRLLQSFEPTGVGARDTAECLCLQLDNLVETHSSSKPQIVPVYAVARLICAEHLELLAAREFVRLRRTLRVDEAVVKAAYDLIRTLNPRPASAYINDAANYVTPDVAVRKYRGRWTAMLNSEVIPRLRVNEIYAQVLQKNRGTELTGQLQEARWLIKNVHQRFDTILRVSQAIVERQRAFFEHGEVAMRPLVLREIAEVLGLHESTVSRVTTSKYMSTPYGTFELKFFFGSHVATDAGGSASSTAIRALIKQLVTVEDPKTPISDSKIADLLGEQGIVVARRTVAKYREALKIPSVAQRKAA
jgi:RNA polymerase sigma-54 factor